MQIGDRVKVPGEMFGTVVCNIDFGQFSPEYPESQWGYLTTGILVLTDEAGLVHLPDASSAEKISN